MEIVKHQPTEEDERTHSLIQVAQATSEQPIAFPLARITTCGTLTIQVLQSVHSSVGGQQAIYGPPDPALLAKKGASTAFILLALLASQPGSFVKKDWLSEKLGHFSKEEDADGEGLKRVDNVVSLLRSLLYPPRAHESQEEHLLRRRLVEYRRASGDSGPGYQLAGMPLIWLDVAEIEAHVKRARRLEQFGTDGLAEWQAAYDLAMRGVFLPGEAYSDWAEWRRKAIETHLWDCVQVLWHRFVEQGAAGETEALRILRDYWQLHVASEDALRPLLELLGKREWYGQAKEYYDQLCAALDLEGKQPDQRTRDIMDFQQAVQIQRKQGETSAVEAAKRSKPPLVLLDDQQDEGYTLFSQAVKRGILDAIHELVGGDMDQLRRQFLQQILATVSTTLLIPNDNLLHPIKQMNAVQSRTPHLRLYEYLLSSSWERYYTSSSQSLIPIIDDCLHSLADITKEARDSEQTQSLALLCQFYQLSGVIARDRMDITRALSDGKQSIELAFMVDSAELIAASLFRRAKTYLKQQRSDKALQDLDAALIYACRSRDPLKGYVHQAAAEAYTSIAAPQDQHLEQKSLALLDNVGDLLQNGKLEDDGSFVKINISGLSIDRARVLTHFQKPQEARQTLVVARQHLGVELTRWQCRLLVAEAEIYLAENNAQGCCEALFDALKVVRATNSRSNEARIDTLHRQLKARYPHYLLVRQLDEQLHAL